MMADMISNWLFEHCPGLVSALSSLSPWAVLALTAAICAAIVMGGRLVNSSVTAKPRRCTLQRGGFKRGRKGQRRGKSGAKRVHKNARKSAREWFRDEEEFDPEWMDARLFSQAKKDERNRRGR